MPARTLSSLCIWRWLSSSSASSRSRCDPANVPISRISAARISLMVYVPSLLSFFRRQEPREDRGRPLPVAGFSLHLLPACARQAVILRAAVVLGNTPVGRDEALLFELQQGGVDRPVVHAQAV